MLITDPACSWGAMPSAMSQRRCIGETSYFLTSLVETAIGWQLPAGSLGSLQLIGNAKLPGGFTPGSNSTHTQRERNICK